MYWTIPCHMNYEGISCENKRMQFLVADLSCLTVVHLDIQLIRLLDKPININKKNDPHVNTKFTIERQ